MYTLEYNKFDESIMCCTDTISNLIRLYYSKIAHTYKIHNMETAYFILPIFHN